MDVNTIFQQFMLASQNYIQNRTAAVYLELTPQETFVGSALCIAIEGRTFIATAAHNFDGLSSRGRVTVFSANRSSAVPLAVIAGNYRSNRAADTPDVAWLEIDQSSAASSDLVGIHVESILMNHQLDSSFAYLITGFPRDLMRESKIGNHTNIVLPLVLYMTGISPHGNSGDDIVLDYQRQGIGPNGFGTMSEPHGMSGGGIWLIPSSTENPSVWSPTNIRPIGITTRYFRSQNEVRGVRMQHWLQMLMDDLPELRSALKPLLSEA